jgi:hypothetical protein
MGELSSLTFQVRRQADGAASAMEATEMSARLADLEEQVNLNLFTFLRTSTEMGMPQCHFRRKPKALGARKIHLSFW